MATESRFQITATEDQIMDGPSKFDLMAALFDGKRVQFTLGADRVRILETVQILSIEAEDGSRESWNISGITSNSHSFTGYYSSKNRKGYMKVEF